MELTVSEMKIEDYDEVLDLWKRCEGIGLSQADEREPLERFLIQNQGLCFTAWMNGQIVGTCLCGCDGRRGYLYHLAVDADARRQGIGQMLVELSLSGLRKRNIQKCHLMVFADNLLGQTFWSGRGWDLRKDILTMSQELNPAGESGSCPC